MENGALKIGEYEEGDIDEIISIERDSHPTPWSENLFRSEITSPISRLLVGRTTREQEECVAGYIVYWRVDDEIHLHNIAVRRDMRRRGIASRVLAEAIRRSQMEGARWITLEVRHSNVPAQRMYDKFGFTVRGIRPGYYTDTKEDALIMWADLRLISTESPQAPGQGRRKMEETQSMMTGVIRENRRMASDHFQMTVILPPSFPIPAPGQFVMVHETNRGEPLLARPLSVYGFKRQGDHSVLELLYRLTGRGTVLFSKMKPGDELTLIGPLGKGFIVPAGVRRVLFIAGGVGAAPLIYLLQQRFQVANVQNGPETIFYLGARRADLLIGLERLKGTCDLRLCTDDGSRGYHGLVTELLENEIEGYDPNETVLFACGPTPMIHVLGRLLESNPVPCQVSIEERMACGLGACLGCVVAIRGSGEKREYVRVCQEGPVFDLREILPISPVGMQGKRK